MVERHLAKVNVASSNLVFRSIIGKLLIEACRFYLLSEVGVIYEFTKRPCNSCKRGKHKAS